MYLVVKKFYTLSDVFVSPQTTILKAFQHLEDAKEYVESRAARDLITIVNAMNLILEILGIV